MGEEGGGGEEEGMEMEGWAVMLVVWGWRGGGGVERRGGKGGKWWGPCVTGTSKERGNRLAVLRGRALR
jgi:hypothetical protein